MPRIHLKAFLPFEGARCGISPHRNGSKEVGHLIQTGVPAPAAVACAVEMNMRQSFQFQSSNLAVQPTWVKDVEDKLSLLRGAFRDECIHSQQYCTLEYGMLQKEELPRLKAQVAQQDSLRYLEHLHRPRPSYAGPHTPRHARVALEASAWAGGEAGGGDPRVGDDHGAWRVIESSLRNSWVRWR